jgi:hypothetical protein
MVPGQAGRRHSLARGSSGAGAFLSAMRVRVRVTGTWDEHEGRGAVVS